jgi:hypothetical protein
MNNKLKPVECINASIGALPTSYLASLSYEQQLIYLCRKMDEIINFVNNNITEQIKEYINQEFNNIMLNAMYDAETETLILYLDNVGD